eukprot:402297_1
MVDSTALFSDGGQKKHFFVVNIGFPSNEKSALEAAIQKHGGIVVKFQSPDSIVLVHRDVGLPALPRRLRGGATPLYRCTFVEDCVRENRLLNLQDYRLRVHMQCSVPSSTARRGRTAYSQADDHAILKQVYEWKQSGVQCFKGNNLWMEFAKSGILPGRGWMSLRGRYMKVLQRKEYAPPKRIITMRQESPDEDERKSSQSQPSESGSQNSKPNTISQPDADSESSGESESELQKRNITSASSHHSGHVDSRHSGQVDSSRVGQVDSSHSGKVDSSRVGQVKDSRVGQVDSSRIGQVDSSRVCQVGSSNVGQVNSSRVGQVDSSRIGQVDSSRVGQVDSSHSSHVDRSRVGQVGSSHISAGPSGHTEPSVASMSSSSPAIESTSSPIHSRGLRVESLIHTIQRSYLVPEEVAIHALIVCNGSVKRTETYLNIVKQKRPRDLQEWCDENDIQPWTPKEDDIIRSTQISAMKSLKRKRTADDIERRTEFLGANNS